MPRKDVIVDSTQEFAPVMGYKRTQPRYQAEITITARIVIPEDTLQPNELNGKTMNISANGMKICIYGFPHSFYHKILQERRMVRICIESPLTKEIIKLVGNVIWVDFCRETGKDIGSCYMGVSFDTTHKIQLSVYHQMIDDLLNK